jgi:MFS family permease
VKFSFNSYPRAFNGLMGLYFLNRIGASLIWPFIAIYIHEQTGASITTIAALTSLQAVTSVVGTSLVSVWMDRTGRKIPMLVGLIGSTLMLLAMSRADMIWQWAILIIFYGTLMPIFMIATNASIADLIPPEGRTAAYALARTLVNIAIPIGPILGGVLITQSHLFAYYTMAGMNVVLAVIVALFWTETLPSRKRKNDEVVAEEQDSESMAREFGYMLTDKPFMLFCASYALIEIGAAMVFNLLAVFVKENYGIVENQYAYILSLNAVMVVLFQYLTTRLTRRFQRYTLIAIGAGFYSAGLISFGLSRTLPHFMISMGILTIGELLAAPTATALVATLAPASMRARYMGIFALLYPIGAGIGPLFGGLLSERYGPSAMWFGGAAAAGLGVLGFWAMIPRRKAKREESAVAA